MIYSKHPVCKLIKGKIIQPSNEKEVKVIHLFYSNMLHYIDSESHGFIYNLRMHRCDDMMYYIDVPGKFFWYSPRLVQFQSLKPLMRHIVRLLPADETEWEWIKNFPIQSEKCDDFYNSNLKFFHFKLVHMCLQNIMKLLVEFQTLPQVLAYVRSA